MAVRVQPRQLAFALPHAESLTRDNFLEGPANEAGLALIERWPDWPNRIMLLVGPEGSGKSHLAAIWAEEAGARSISAHALTPASVPGALATGALVVEDLKPADFDERAHVPSDESGAGRRSLRADDGARCRPPPSRSSCAICGHACARCRRCRCCRPTICCSAA